MSDKEMKVTEGAVGVNENRGLITINQIQKISRNPSLIAKLARILSEAIGPAFDSPQTPLWKEYDIEEKIEFNAVKKHCNLIREYGQYGGVVESSYKTLDGERPNSKKKILQAIKREYQKALIAKTSDLNAEASKAERLTKIRECSDSIIDDVMAQVKQLIVHSSDGQQLHIEDIDIGVEVLVAHAFIECKVLEHPKS